MARTAVIFDTNSCHVDRTAQSFFGQHTILEEIASRATIIMPQVVIDELMQQNIEGTNESITALKSNPLLPVLDFDLSKLDEIIDHEHAKSLMLAEKVAHEIVDITDTNHAFVKIRAWVIPGRPPFNKRNADGKNNSDKGLKDALVACTVDEILKKSEYETYYLATGDGRLKDYYAGNRQITCLLPMEILDELKREFFDEYTIDVIRNAIGKKSATLKENWLNINSDVVALFEDAEYLTLVILDAESKEIVGTSDAALIGDSGSLASSGSYSTTHDVVTEIMGSLEYYAQKELVEIKDALTTNDQVYGIGTDEDIKALASAIYSFFQSQLTEDEKHRFDVYYNLKEL
jgi:hypothetical protein